MAIGQELEGLGLSVTSICDGRPWWIAAISLRCGNPSASHQAGSLPSPRQKPMPLQARASNARLSLRSHCPARRSRRRRIRPLRCAPSRSARAAAPHPASTCENPHLGPCLIFVPAQPRNDRTCLPRQPSPPALDDFRPDGPKSMMSSGNRSHFRHHAPMHHNKKARAMPGFREFWPAVVTAGRPVPERPDCRLPAAVP